MKSKIAIKRNDKTYFVSPKEILYCTTTSGDGTKIVLQSGKSIFSSYRLKRFEEKLCPKRFIKSHQSYLINLAFIRELRKDKVILINEYDLPLVNGYYSKIIEKFSQI